MQNIRASSDSIGPLRRESLHRYSFHCNVSSLWQYQPCSKTLMYKCHFQTGNQEKQNIGASFILNSCHFSEMTQELCRAVLSLFQLWRGSFKKELVIIPPYIFSYKWYVSLLFVFFCCCKYILPICWKGYDLAINIQMGVDNFSATILILDGN